MSKPGNFSIRVRQRTGRTAIMPLSVARSGDVAPQPVATPTDLEDGHRTPLLVLFGSNLGTAEGLAHSTAEDARRRGFIATVGSLDEHVDALPKDGAVVIITASYNGQPPDNAGKFCQWLRDPLLPSNAFAGVTCSIFGCGNRDWGATYQAVPTLIDTELEKHGARPLCTRGEGDARDDFDHDWRTWYAGLFPSLSAALRLPEGAAQAQATQPRFSVAFVNKLAVNPIIRSYSAVAMTVHMNRELQHRDCARPSERSTRHLEVTLPPGLDYRAGDHLGIVPRNGLDAIRRVLLRFRLDPSLYVTISPRADATTHLPVNESVPLLGILANRVELQDVATRAQLATLAEYAKDDAERQTLRALGGGAEAGEAGYQEQVLAPRKSVLDLLDDFPSCAPPFEVFLEPLPPLRPRYYSISSSPLVTPETCSITVGVLDQSTRNGRGVFRGVCSNYLAGLSADATLHGFIRKPTIPFNPPENPHAPMIMVGPGTGVAPFRGFLQERATLKEHGVPIGPSLLFFGCRDPLQDFLYEKEMRAFEATGVTQLFCAFSREPGRQKTYVQQLIREQGEEVWRLLQQEAVVFVCGEASRMAPQLRQAFVDLFCERTGAGLADGQAWLAGLVTGGRYLEYIWAST